MRLTFLISALLACASPAFATDSGDAAFELLSRYTAEKQQLNYIKLQSTISLSDAKSIDARITKIYGDPTTDRRGLKVWEFANTSGSGGNQTTIMCGPDGNGGIFISADRRGPKPIGANSRAKARQALRASKARTTSSRSIATQNNTGRSQERD